MTKVKLSPRQAAELNLLYLNELEKIRQRSAEIIALLKALDQPGDDQAESLAQKDEKPSETEIQEQKTEPPKWGEYIMKLLNERQRGVTVSQIYKSYIKEYGKVIEDEKAAKNRLGQALHYLQNTKKLIEGSNRKGKRGNIYRLIQEAAPKPKVESKSTSTPVKPKATRTKKATPKKAEPEKAPVTPPEEMPEEKYLQFVEDTLNKERRILDRNEFVKYAMVYFNLPLRNKISTRGKVIKALNYMTKDSGALKKTKKKNQNGTFFGLTDWFEDNKLIPEYK